EKNDKIFDFHQIDMSVNKLQCIIKNIEEQEKQTIAVEINKNPFRQPGAESSRMTSDSASILKQDYISTPDFKVSGILYDKEKPMVIIDDEVKSENEIKSGYTIYRILADRVILRRENKEFVLYISPSISAKNIDDGINLSDATDSGDTEIYAKENITYSILRKLDHNAFETSEKISPTIDREVKPEKKKEKVFGETDVKTLSLSPEKILTVQVASFGKNRKQQAIEFARKLENSGFENIRVEKINGIYTVRAGKTDDRNDLINLCQQLKQFSETSFIRTAYVIQNRIIYPPMENINL
ncbi:MAG: SPOR domain-containing protein, partial [Candidatus Omnitrophica bacterium]|nr:SPOR domain-containing protein [Candidatus Omnitrophota bacterium]